MSELRKYPTGVYRCPLGDHPILLRDGGSIVPHYDERGCRCVASDTTPDAMDTKPYEPIDWKSRAERAEKEKATNEGTIRIQASQINNLVAEKAQLQAELDAHKKLAQKVAADFIGYPCDEEDVKSIENATVELAIKALEDCYQRFKNDWQNDWQQLQARVEELSKLVLYWKDRCDLDEQHIANLEEKLKRAGEALIVHPVSEYHEDYGTVLWWHDPVEEPPYIGTLNDLNPGTVPRLVREGWLTQWSKIPTVWDGDGKLRAAIESVHKEGK